jgi:predicted transcriptional regulator
LWGSLLSKYRHRLEIIRDILLVVSGNEGVRKTHIMYGANLGYKILVRYLDELLKLGLLECEDKSCYRLREKGEKFLRLYEEYEKRNRDLEEQICKLEKERRFLMRVLS